MAVGKSSKVAISSPKTEAGQGGRAGAQDLSEAARRSGEAETLAGQNGKCALCGCGLTAGTCGQRANSAGAARQLPQQEDAERERAARQESRRAALWSSTPRSPKLPPLVFEAQACQRDALLVGVHVVRGPTPPSPCRSCPADGVEPVDGVLPHLGFVKGCCNARQSCLNLLPYVGLAPEGFAGRDAGPGRLPQGPRRVGHLRAEPRGRGDAAARAGADG